MKKLLNIMLVIALIIPMTFFTVNAGEEENTPEEDNSQFVLANGLDLTKKVTPFGDPIDRTYQVDLTVKGELETFYSDGEIFLLIDLTALNAGGGNMNVWPFYLRGIWNMCDEMVKSNPTRTFNFHLIVVNDGEEPVINNKVFTVSDSSRSQLGDPDLLYIEKNENIPITDQNGKYIPKGYPLEDYYILDENGNQIIDPETNEPMIDESKYTIFTNAVGQLWRNYNAEILGEESLLGYLSNMSGLTLPNKLNSTKGSMDFLFQDKSGGLADIETITGKKPINSTVTNHEANVALALKTMNDVIEFEHLQNSQAVMLLDTVPSAFNGQVGSITDPETIAPILRETYTEYEKSVVTNNVLFHMFALDTFSSKEDSENVMEGAVVEMWKEFTENVGKNNHRDIKENQPENAGYYSNSKYTEYKWIGNEVNKNNYFNFEWDHTQGSSSSINQLKNSRSNMNTSLQNVATSVGDGLTQNATFANIVFVQDEIPDAFHVLNTDEFKPTVSTKKDEQTDWSPASNNLVERTDIYPANDMGMLNVPDAEFRWETSGIRWKMNHLTTEDGTYKFTFYIKANEDYFGGEYIDANKDAGVYYMDYSQYQLHGNKDPSEWKNEYFTKEDFVYKIEDTRSDTSVGEPTYDYVYLDEYKQQKQKNPSFAEAQTGEDKCDINVYVPWYHETLNGEATIFYGDNVTISSADLNDSSNGLYNWGKSNERNANVEYFIPYYASIHEQDGGICETESYASWKDKNGNPLKFDYSWKVYSNVDKSKPTLITEIDSGEQKKLDEIMLSFVGEPDADVFYKLNYKLSRDKETTELINDIELKAGNWSSSDGDSKFEFEQFDGGETQITVNVEYGSITLSKKIISSAISPEELANIDFKTGFPVEVKADNRFASTPTIRQGEDGKIMLTGLKRGNYTLEEIVPQKFKFLHFSDTERGYTGEKAYKNPIYPFEIGFDDEENSVYQDNEILITNDYYLDKWYSSIHEIDNIVKSYGSSSEVSNE